MKSREGMPIKVLHEQLGKAFEKCFEVVFRLTNKFLKNRIAVLSHRESFN